MSAGNLLPPTLAAAGLATLTLAGAATAGGEVFDYRAEIIEKFVNPCIIGVVRGGSEELSISDDEITYVVRSFTRNGLEEMLDIWVPKVDEMTETERESFYSERLDWCISAHLEGIEHENIQGVAAVLE